MKSICILAAIAVLSFGDPAFAEPVVEVHFVDPDRFTDASPSSHSVSERERDAALALLREHLETLGTKYLRNSERLHVEVLDVDLAGAIEPSRLHNGDIRILRDVAIPRIHLRYRLSRSDVESSGEERLAELNYLRESSRCRAGAPLCYEKLMLNKWFVRQIVGVAASPTS